jgi:hypothetical protein
LLGSLLVAHTILDGVLSFPKDWDTLAYHLPLVVHWIREGTLYVPNCADWYCPGNNEILGLWFVAPFSGDFFIALNNLPAIILMAAAAVELAAVLGVSRPLCHLSGMAIVATTPAWRQAVSAENDVAVAALFLATLFYVVRYARDHRLADLILASATVGLLTGTKYFAVGYAGVAGIGVIALLLACHRPRDAARAAVFGLVGTLLLGGYWYIRNTWTTGTPFYPMGFTESTDLWAAMRPDSHTSALLRSGRSEVWPLLGQAVTTNAGPAQLVAVLFLPVVSLWLAISAWKWRSKAPFASAVRVWLVLIISLSALVYLMTPNVVETKLGTLNMLRSEYHSVRFGLCFLSLAVIGLTVVIDDLARLSSFASPFAARELTRHDWALQNSNSSNARRWFLWPLRGLCSAVVLFQLTLHSVGDLKLSTLLVAWVVVLGGVIVLLFARPASDRERAVAGLLILWCMTATAWSVEAIADRWHRDFVDHFEAVFACDVFSSYSQLDLQNERICVLDHRYYPFFGSNRQLHVCRPLWIPDYPHFLNYLRCEQITLLVVRNKDPNVQRRYAEVKKWTTDRPELFQKTWEDVKYTLVRVDPSEIAATPVVLSLEKRTPRLQSKTRLSGV